MLELIYTSTPSGLQPGRSGFTSVAWTRGIPPILISPLENLSAYRQLFMPEDENYSRNPVIFSAVTISVGSTKYPVVSRISACGLDYTGRTNKIAHHIVCEPSDASLTGKDGPIVLILSAKSNFCSRWDKPPKLLPPRLLFRGDALRPGAAETWRTTKGDAGWAGVIALRFLNSLATGEKESLYLSYAPGTPAEKLLGLSAEVIALLPAEARSAFTFNTCFLQDSRSVECFFRMGLDDSPLLQAAARVLPRNFIVLETKEPVPAEYENDPLVAFARSGNPPLKGFIHEPPRETPAAPSGNPAKTMELSIPVLPSKPLKKAGSAFSEFSGTASPELPAFPETPPPQKVTPLIRKTLFFLTVFLLVAGGSFLAGKQMVPPAQPPLPPQEKQAAERPSPPPDSQERTFHTTKPPLSQPPAAKRETAPLPPETTELPPEESFPLFAEIVYGNAKEPIPLPPSWGPLLKVQTIPGRQRTWDKQGIRPVKAVVFNISLSADGKSLIVSRTTGPAAQEVVSLLVFHEKNGRCREMPFGFRPEYAGFFRKTLRFDANYTLTLAMEENEKRYPQMIGDYLDAPSAAAFSSFAQSIGKYNEALGREQNENNSWKKQFQAEKESREKLKQHMRSMDLDLSAPLPEKQSGTPSESATLKMLKNIRAALVAGKQEDAIVLFDCFCRDLSKQKKIEKDSEKWVREHSPADAKKSADHATQAAMNAIRQALFFSSSDSRKIEECLREFYSFCEKIVFPAERRKEISAWLETQKKNIAQEEFQKTLKEFLKAREESAKQHKKTADAEKKRQKARENREAAQDKLKQDAAVLGLQETLFLPCFEAGKTIPPGEEKILRALKHAAEEKMKFTLKQEDSGQ